MTDGFGHDSRHAAFPLAGMARAGISDKIVRVLRMLVPAMRHNAIARMHGGGDDRSHMLEPQVPRAYGST